jgi:hypothetical protein
MGFGGACYRSLGRAAVKGLLIVCAVACCASLSACSVVSDISGAAAGIAAGTATANPAVGIGVGITVKAATREAVTRLAREQHNAEQDAIAAAASDLRVGQTQQWSLDRKIVRDTHGEVRVLRVIKTPLAACKELAFSIADKAQQRTPAVWFTTTACREGSQWKWAAAEPAVDRWGYLQ